MVAFDENYDAYMLELDGVLFRWEEKPDAAAEKAAERAAAAYHKNLRRIAEFLIDDLIRDIWGISDPEQVIARLSGDTGRPLIKGRNPEDIRRMMDERLPLYLETADFSVDTGDKAPDEIAREIADLIALRRL